METRVFIGCFGLVGFPKWSLFRSSHWWLVFINVFFFSFSPSLLACADGCVILFPLMFQLRCYNFFQNECISVDVISFFFFFFFFNITETTFCKKRQAESFQWLSQAADSRRPSWDKWKRIGLGKHSVGGYKFQWTSNFGGKRGADLTVDRSTANNNLTRTISNNKRPKTRRTTLTNNNKNGVSIVN
jgi:hypothetical protein